jgi:hypothetical protein
MESDKISLTTPVKHTVVRLDDTVTRTSTSNAATANSVRTAMSKAWEACINANEVTAPPVASTGMAGIVASTVE